MVPNIGIVDSNVRKFLALPFTVLVVASGLVYHAYAFAAVCAAIAMYAMMSGIVRVSLLYRLMGWSTVGGPHRARADSSARRA